MSRGRSSERSSIGRGVGRRGVRASWCAGAPNWILAVTGMGRAVKAGRRPPVGEALTARSVTPGIMVVQARQGLVVAPSRFWGLTRALVVSRSPRVVEDKQAGLGCLVMSSPGPVAGAGMERSGAASSAQSLITTTLRGGVMPNSELVCWLRPSFTPLRLGRGNGSRRRASRSRRG